MTAREQGTEQIPLASNEQDTPTAEAVSSFSTRAEEAERAARAALDRAAQAEAAVVQLQAEKEAAEQELMFKAHEAEKVTEAAVQRAEVAEGALRHVDAVEHKIAKLQRILRKRSALQKKVSVDMACVLPCSARP